MRALNKFSDKLLSAFVGKAVAGACVPENGSKGWYDCGSCKCEDGQRWIKKQCEYRVTCYGGTVDTGATRCITTQNIC
ncbi:hypothetical protein Afil01_09910 [Actinorhabdospora filicis]|uniref:Uncharacterized protein n=1 Tax=Actinorhabdospora filicis TaxID=1785913 RepID=A0A9W6SFG1_9ACTN|nr:hypothetical protein [Actinorhabdospora filicis]GLZ76184.1 hypothetical protein Afil01_09910 [Actinorhabdospora filicis]